MSISKVPDPKTVTIRPLVVEILAIKIGNKQMTQSIFKQLQIRDLISIENEESIDPKVYFDGEIWGWVNHTVDGYHRHAVYTHSGMLYKAPICPKEDISRLTKKPNLAISEQKDSIDDIILDIDSLVALYIFNALVDGLDENLLSVEIKEKPRSVFFKSPFFSFTADTYNCKVYLNKSSLDYNHQVRSDVICSFHELKIGLGLEAEDSYRNVFVRHNGARTYQYDDFVRGLKLFSIDWTLNKTRISQAIGPKLIKMIELRDRSKAYRENLVRSRAQIIDAVTALSAEITDKPQLFIAV